LPQTATFGYAQRQEQGFYTAESICRKSRISDIDT
jgi:hypothetical protein